MNETVNLALWLGFLLGLKHATEADHIVAVSTIVSEQRSVWRSALVGALWGIGHTASLLIAGIIVISLRVAIPETIAAYLEFGVALMIILLGTHVLYRVLRDNRRVHVHAHEHDGYTHTHLHFHDERSAHDSRDAAHGAPHTHVIGNLGWKPLLVGMVHGLAGSAALTLLVLTEVMRGGSSALGLAYLLVFGIGSIGGMLLMSALIGLPFVFTAERFARLNVPIRVLAGLGSILFGFYYAWETWAG